MTADGGAIEGCPLRDDLVICTRNRVDDLKRCLESVQFCGPHPTTVIIVDSSENDLTEILVNRYASADPWRGRLRYMRTEPGLPLQRNRGVASSTADVIHFIDDDAVPEPDYFNRIVECFEEEGEAAVGVCGLITNLGPRGPVSWVNRLFSLDGSEGTVLRSGLNVLVFSDRGRRQVEWLSGCAMSYRRAVLSLERFDESLVGYALGEDVDLSTRVRHHGLLFAEPSARLAHLESPAERWSMRRRIRTEIVHRRQRVKRAVAGESSFVFWWSCMGQVIVHVVKAVVRRSRHNALAAWWTVRGIVDAVAGGRS